MVFVVLALLGDEELYFLVESDDTLFLGRVRLFLSVCAFAAYVDAGGRRTS